MTRWPLIELDDASILHADDDLVAVDKAAGVLCDASRDPERDHVGRALSRWAQSRGEDPEFHAVHRLDLATSGVVVFGRSAAATTALMRQFQTRSVVKQYQAIVHRADDTWVVGTSLERRSHLRHRRGTTEEVRSGGKPAQSAFEVVEVRDRLALVRATPSTGRTHQLRVHLAALGAPIVGDDRYGPGDDSASRLWLHARRLTLDHPATGQPLTLESQTALRLEDAR